MLRKFSLIFAIFFAVIFPINSFANSEIEQKFRSDYANLVYLNYVDAHKDAKFLKKQIDNFLNNPNKVNLDLAKDAWLKARKSYGQTEVFRFYEGPIDFVDSVKKIEGPESRLNAWPIDESYIDYTFENSKSGIVNNSKISITKDSLKRLNQVNDESQVSVGYHAIEFLLWGQDLSLKSAGNRPFSDYIDNEQNSRRRQYLKIVTEDLIEDLKFLVDQWNLNSWSFGNNYAKEFVKKDGKINAVENVLTSLATLSGFEMASERMATALDSKDQEDEQSCFSDNTHNDFIYNQQGIKNVFLGSYGAFKGVGIYDLIAQKDKKLADKILQQINKTAKIIGEIPYPIDSEVLATKNGSKGRLKAELAVSELQKQSKLFLQAGKLLNINVKIMDK